MMKVSVRCQVKHGGDLPLSTGKGGFFCHSVWKLKKNMKHSQLCLNFLSMLQINNCNIEELIGIEVHFPSIQ